MMLLRADGGSAEIQHGAEDHSIAGSTFVVWDFHGDFVYTYLKTSIMSTVNEPKFAERRFKKES